MDVRTALRARVRDCIEFILKTEHRAIEKLRAGFCPSQGGSTLPAFAIELENLWSDIVLDQCLQADLSPMGLILHYALHASPASTKLPLALSPAPAALTTRFQVVSG